MTIITPSKRQALEKLRKEKNACGACSSAQGVTHYVFGKGNPEAKLLLAGEAPGFNEDREGVPFVGKAGRLLDRLLRAAGFDPGELYYTNVVKCRPMRDPAHPAAAGNDRPPTKKETAACLPVLKEQIAIIAPAIVCTLGNTPLATLAGRKGTMGTLHGRCIVHDGIRLFPTYHPAAVFHRPLLREILLGDLKVLKTILDRSAFLQSVSER